MTVLHTTLAPHGSSYRPVATGNRHATASIRPPSSASALGPRFVPRLVRPQPRRLSHGPRTRLPFVVQLPDGEG